LLDAEGFAFLFARFHPAMRPSCRCAAPLAVRTVFNLLGRSPTRPA
jgi:anthranilate phosphoribosyltransferase